MTTAAVYAGDFPDPFVLVSGDGYYAFSTNSRGTNVPVIASSDLSSWRDRGDALPVLPAWAESGHTWSPSVLARPGGYAMYYTVREPRSGRQAISVALADGPEGPYTDIGDGPLVFQQELGGSIDPSPFVDEDGQAYLLWKADANAVGRPATLWAQPLAADGFALLGTPAKLLTHDCRWERPLIEAPAMVRTAGAYYLFYSGNWWARGDYAIGYAVAATILGPYRKVTTVRPWFGSDADVAGPGGQEFFRDLSGGLQMAFHGWQPGVVGYPDGVRSLRITPVAVADLPRQPQDTAERRWGRRITKRSPS
jgi:beta-xylosidase